MSKERYTASEPRLDDREANILTVWPYSIPFRDRLCFIFSNLFTLISTMIHKPTNLIDFLYLWTYYWCICCSTLLHLFLIKKRSINLVSVKNSNMLSNARLSYNENTILILSLFFFLFSLQDLVAWITLGFHHIPQLENIPSTNTLGTKVSFLLMPFNYFDKDPLANEKDRYFFPVDDW